MNAQELKAAFVEKFAAEWNASASARARRIQTKPHTETAWENHMAAVVCGKVDEEPATGGVEPEWSDEYSAHPTMGGFVTTEKGGIRTSKSAAESCRGGDQTKWVVVGLATGPAAVTIEEAYALGGRELQVWPV